MATVLQEILATGVVRGSRGEVHELHSHVDAAEGEFLKRMIRENEVDRCLEIGCAYGISSLYICEALAERASPYHLILDPYQTTFWSGIGKLNLERSGFDFWELRERPSEYALPELIAAGHTFDCAFVDGNHEFPQVMFDMLLVNRLVRPRGIVIFDDTQMGDVAAVIRVAQRRLGYEAVDFVRGSRKAPRSIGKATRQLRRRLTGAWQRITAPDLGGRPAWLRSQSSMVALRRTPLDPSAERIAEILGVDARDRDRGASIEETCQRFAITPDRLREWRRNRLPPERGPAPRT